MQSRSGQLYDLEDKEKNFGNLRFDSWEDFKEILYM